MAEPISLPKAPKGWAPSADQAAKIRGDARLQRMSRDEQYLYFNHAAKPSAPAKPKPADDDSFSGSFKKRAREGGGILGYVSDRVSRAMKGS